MRLRQIALVARDVKAARAGIEEWFGLPLVWQDPGIGGSFGLENILYAFAGNVLEVVAPIKPGTTAGRLLDKQGDGGYMLIFHTQDALAERERVKQLGIRSVWEANREGYTATHFHPVDTSGVGGIPSIDSTFKPSDPLDEYSIWSPIYDKRTGPSSWLATAQSPPSSRLAFAGVTVQSRENPHMVAAWWSRILDLPVHLEDGDSVINTSNLPIRFVKAKEGPNGILCIDVGVDGEDPKVAYERASRAPGAVRGSIGGKDAVKIVGVWWRFQKMPEGAKAKI